ncbi:MAG: thiamine pyrophosphate-dependent enzyme [Candidatus Firestonebacteria bacterium]
MIETKELPKELFFSGHTACSGCGVSLAARLVFLVTGPNVIATNVTGCLEVFTTRSPQTAWGIPWIHSLFENAASVATGISAALKTLGQEDKVKVIAMGGDGGTADIGFGIISGMWERDDDILYICYDNEAYMNTGIQRSGLTPFRCATSTSPSGKISLGNQRPKKNLPAIAVAHGVKYVATATVGYTKDLQNKVKKALSIKGSKYIQILTPCPLGWGFDTSLTIQMAKLAVETGLNPVYEIENGKLSSVLSVKRKPVEEFLKSQARFKHLFTKEGGAEIIKEIQKIADENFEKFIVCPHKAGNYSHSDCFAIKYS